MNYFFLLNLIFLNNFSNSFFLKKIFLNNNFFIKNSNNHDIESIYINYLKDFNKLENYQIQNNKAFSTNFYDNNNFDIFKKNYQIIQHKNKELLSNNNSFQLGFNYDFDNILYNSPINNLMNIDIPVNQTKKINFKKYIKNPLIYLKNVLSFKKELNWNNTNFLSDVKNQGNCGSCWAFASTTALETFMRFNNYNVSRLSEQELIDCSKKNHGCNGGFMHTAFDYIIDNKGLVLDEQYPYVARTEICKLCKCENNTHIIDYNIYNQTNCNYSNCDSYNCNYSNCDSSNCDSCSKNFNISNILHLNKVNGSHLKEYEFNIPNSILDRILSLQISPITIAIDASSIYFRYYKNGIIDINLNETQKLNHAVLLIGYGLDDDGLYWIIQNSWGKDWGDNGYCKIRVEEGEGILLSNIYGVYPSKL